MCYLLIFPWTNVASQLRLTSIEALTHPLTCPAIARWPTPLLNLTSQQMSQTHLRSIDALTHPLACPPIARWLIPPGEFDESTDESNVVDVHWCFDSSIDLSSYCPLTHPLLLSMLASQGASQGASKLDVFVCVGVCEPHRSGNISG